MDHSNLLRASLANGNITNIQGWNSFDAAVILTDLIKTNQIIKTEGWELRILANYITIIKESKNILDDIIKTNMELLSLVSKLEIVLVDQVRVDDFVYGLLLVKIDPTDTNVMVEIINIKELEQRFFGIGMPKKSLALFSNCIEDIPYQDLHLYLSKNHDLRLKADSLKEMVDVILCDRFDIIRDIPNDEIAELLINRLKTLDPIYLQQLLPCLRKYLDSLELKWVVEINKLDQSFFQLDPNISEITWRLRNRSLSQQAYLLGFPIHLAIPDQKTIDRAIAHLNKVGLETYCKEMCAISADDCKYPFSSIKVHNQQNLLLEDIDSYSTFDRVKFIQGDQLFEITRDSFGPLTELKYSGQGDVKNPENPYTREPLSQIVIETIKSRNKLAKESELPPSKPLIELLSTLQINKVERKPPPVEEINPRRIRNLFQHDILWLVNYS